MLVNSTFPQTLHNSLMSQAARVSVLAKSYTTLQLAITSTKYILMKLIWGMKINCQNKDWYILHTVSSLIFVPNFKFSNIFLCTAWNGAETGKCTLTARRNIKPCMMLTCIKKEEKNAFSDSEKNNTILKSLVIFSPCSNCLSSWLAKLHTSCFF